MRNVSNPSNQSGTFLRASNSCCSNLRCALDRLPGSIGFRALSWFHKRFRKQVKFWLFFSHAIGTTQFTRRGSHHGSLFLFLGSIRLVSVLVGFAQANRFQMQPIKLDVGVRHFLITRIVQAIFGTVSMRLGPRCRHFYKRNFLLL